MSFSPSHNITLSIVLPSYKGDSLLKRHIPDLKEYLSQFDMSFEIIVVDDGSEDDGATKLIAEELGCRYLANSKNAGKGAAVRKGVLDAKGKYIIFTDVDFPYTFSAINRFLYYLDFKDYHMVAGDRTLDKSHYYAKIPLLRQILSHIFSNFAGRFFVGGWYDTQCGIKGFRSDVAKDIFTVGRINRFAFDVELFYIALKRNYDIKRVPVVLRVQEGSVVNILRDGLVMLKDVLRIRWYYWRGRYRRKTPANSVDYTVPDKYYIPSNKDKHQDD